MISRFQRWLSARLSEIPAKLNGSHVTTKSERFTGLSSKARFSPDDQLLLRMARARDELPPNNVKRLIEPKIIVE